jgi:hypothetical protein
VAGFVAKTNAREVTFEAFVTRADGTVEPLGVVAYYNRNPLRRWAWALRKGAPWRR